MEREDWMEPVTHTINEDKRTVEEQVWVVGSWTRQEFPLNSNESKPEL